MNVTFIGAGNVATHLARALQAAGVTAEQVYSRTAASASALAQTLGCGWTTEISEVRPGADLYIFSVKDNALEELVGELPPNDGLWIHTAGSMPMELFAGHARHYGVLYPLQTFSKERPLSFRQIPLFIEGATAEDTARLTALARRLSDHVEVLSSERRRYLHLAAVFACNFTNHCYALAGKILAGQAIPFDVLLPLIDETAAKVHDLTPAQAQTGPAIRYDENVIHKQLALIDDPQLRELYRLVSQSIHKEAIQP